MTFKNIENYQLSEDNKYIEDGIQYYIAQHIVSKLPYLLKKVNTNSSDKSKYKSLVNEVGILKILSHEGIVECQKMLKTPNNIYLVYDYCDGSLLSDAIKGMSKETKLSIITQLIEVLKVMNAASVVHCNLKPSSIIVSNDKKIKLMNFTYSVNISKKKNLQTDVRPPASNYVAPEITKQGVAHQKSDLYSLGVIISEMNFSLEKANLLEISTRDTVRQLIKLIDPLLSENPNERPSLQQIQSAIKNRDGKSFRKKSTQIPKSQRKIEITSPNQKQELNSSKKISSPLQASIASTGMGFSMESSKAVEKKFVQQVLKRRNLAIFLLQMSETCLKIDDEDKDKDRKMSIFLSYLLMKKSCIIISGLLSFLKGQKGFEKQLQKVFLDKTKRASFQKKPDYFKIISTVQKQVGNQKRWLDDIYRNIVSQLPAKLKDAATEQTIEDHTLLGYVSQFLADIVSKGSGAEQISSKVLQNLYLLSEIIPHRSYQRMFEEMISEQKISLDEQYLYIHVRKMSKKQLLAQIAARVKTS